MAREAKFTQAAMWRHLPSPAIVASFVPVESAKRWHEGLLSDQELWDQSLKPDNSTGACLFVGFIRGKQAWRAFPQLLKAFNPSALCFRSTHKAITRHAMRWEGEFNRVALNDFRIFGDGEKLERWKQHIAP